MITGQLRLASKLLYLPRHDPRSHRSIPRRSRLDRDAGPDTAAGGNTACLEVRRRRHAHHPRRRHRPAHARQRAHGAAARATRRSCCRTCTGITSPVCSSSRRSTCPGHRVEIASGPNGVMSLRRGDPRAVPRAVLPGRVRRPRRHGHDARAARERSVHDRRHHDHDGAAQPSRSGLRLSGSSTRASRSCTRPTPSTSRASIRRSRSSRRARTS